MRKSRWSMLLMAAVAMMAVLPAAAASAAPPSPETTGSETFICPAVSTHNNQGTWVIGAHGAYYVNIVTRGTPQPMKANKVFVKVDDQGKAVEKAQIPAGFALYKDVFPDAFNADGTSAETVGYDTETTGNVMHGMPQFVVLLGEGIDEWLGRPAGWSEFDMATVVANDDGTYKVTNLSLMKMGASMDDAVLDSVDPVPLAAGVFW